MSNYITGNSWFLIGVQEDVEQKKLCKKVKYKSSIKRNDFIKKPSKVKIFSEKEIDNYMSNFNCK